MLVGTVEIAAPLALAQRLVSTADQPGFGENGADGELGHSARIAAGRVDDADAGSAGRGLHVDVDGAAARDRHEFQPRQTLDHTLRGERRQLRHDMISASAMNSTISSALPMYSFSPVHALHGIAVFHRLIRPGLFHRRRMSCMHRRRLRRSCRGNTVGSMKRSPMMAIFLVMCGLTCLICLGHRRSVGKRVPDRPQCQAGLRGRRGRAASTGALPSACIGRFFQRPAGRGVTHSA